MTTYLREDVDGRLVEYRRHPYDPAILFLEARVLRRDGNPHDDRWYPVSDSELLRLDRSGSDILDLLAAEAG